MSFDAAYLELRPLMIAYLRSRGASAEDAADSAQEALAAAWRRWDSVTDPRSYLMTAAYHKWISMIRRSKRANSVPLDGLEDQMPRRAAGVPITRTCLSAIESLAPTSLEAWQLAWIGCSESEIAARLGITVASVKSRLHRARRALRLAIGS